MKTLWIIRQTLEGYKANGPMWFESSHAGSNPARRQQIKKGP